jgi:hypothetical protein
MATLSPIVALTAASVAPKPDGPIIDQSPVKADQGGKTQTPEAVQAPSKAEGSLESDGGASGSGRGADGRGLLVDVRV